MSLCSKPNCARPGTAVLAFDYDSRKAMIEDRDRRQISPHLYLLCTLCAEKLRPPLGWTLDDRRTKTLAERYDSEVAAAPSREVETVAPQITRAPARRPEPPLEPAAQSRQVFFGFSS
ncbi:MAG TPA: DUF3499 family protein [Actinomycetota bacterium]|nr:DUF3499 family protein [Actinomycetota bacterium]